MSDPLSPLNRVLPVSDAPPEAPHAQDAPREDLDPADWTEFRRLAHRMLDDAIDDIEHVREGPVWRPVPEEVKRRLAEPLSDEPESLHDVYDDYQELIRPFATGNTHPGFCGWVHGGGTPSGMVAEMLAAGMNANLGGRDHGPIYVERQVIQWCRELFGFPATASGLLVTGTSLANLIAVLVARTHALGPEVREKGLQAEAKRLTAYSSRATHGCIRKAMEISGLGSAALRVLPVDEGHRIDVAALAEAIAADRAAGYTPFFAVGTAGTVDVGAIDDLSAMADLCAREGLWFHVDGAFGALAALSDELLPLLRGIERADSIAFDFHKWGQVPYDAGCILVRDGDVHRRTFATQAAYLTRETRGLSAGAPWFCDYGPDLSRGFRALKVWFTLKEQGRARLGAGVARCCRLARLLAERVDAAPDLERLAPVPLNIVCFRYRDDRLAPDALNALNREIVADAQEQGIAAPSTTMIGDRLAIRACIVNHRCDEAHLMRLLQFVRSRGAELAGAELPLAW